MQITEKKLRRLIRSVILESEEQAKTENVNIDQEVVKDAIKLIKKESEIHESMKKVGNLALAGLGAKMTGPLLASLVIGYAHMKGVSPEQLAAGSTQMATEIPRLLGITNKGIIMHMINIIYGLAGVTITWNSWQQYLKNDP